MRHRSFDMEEALDSALEVFWANGYNATSVDDLCQSMAIGRSSLYQAFGSKPNLLEIAIERYAQNSVTRLSGSFSRPGTFKENVRAVLEQYAALAVSGELRRGCFLGELIAEFPANSCRESRLLKKKVQLLKSVIEEAARGAVASGEISSDIDPEDFSHYLFATIQGLRLTGKISPDEKTLQAIIDSAMNRLV